MGPELHEQWFVVSAFRRDALDWVFRQTYPERYVVLEKLTDVAKLHDCKLVILGDAFFSRHILKILPRQRGIEVVAQRGTRWRIRRDDGGIRGSRVLGIDISDRMILVAQRNAEALAAPDHPWVLLRIPAFIILPYAFTTAEPALDLQSALSLDAQVKPCQR